MPNAQLGPIIQYLCNTVGTHAAAAARDGQLLEKFVTCQEEAAFAALLRRHGPMVLRVAKGVLGHEQDAEDVFQATFLLLARKAGSIRKPDSVASWLHGVAYHLAAKARARRTRRQAHERQAAEMRQVEPKLDKAWCQVQSTLHEEIEKLPEKYRIILVLCYLEGKNEAEVSAQLGCPVGTVRSRVARARTQLRKRLARRGLSLSAVLAAAILTAEDVSAAMPARLTSSTIQAALEFAAGGSVHGVTSAQVATLVNGGQPMVLTKVKIATVLFLAISLTATGAGSLAWRALAKSPASSQIGVEEPPPADSKQTAVPNDAPKPQPKDKPAQGEKAAQEVRHPKSYKCQVTYVVRDQNGKEESSDLGGNRTEIHYWSASGAWRQDVRSDGKVVGNRSQAGVARTRDFGYTHGTHGCTIHCFL